MRKLVGEKIHRCRYWTDDLPETNLCCNLELKKQNFFQIAVLNFVLVPQTLAIQRANRTLYDRSAYR